MAPILDNVNELYLKPLLDSVFDAATVHRANHDPTEVQLCTLLSIKTGGCTEDRGYCSQSIHNPTALRNESLLDVGTVMAEARRAKESGSTRFCMGAAWRQPTDGRAFERVLEMVRGVRAIGLEACATVPIAGTPLAQAEPIDMFEWIRVIAICLSLCRKQWCGYRPEDCPSAVKRKRQCYFYRGQAPDHAQSGG